MSESFLHFSRAEVAAGILFASEDHFVGKGQKRVFVEGVRLDTDTLRNLANHVGEEWYAAGRDPRHLYEAKGAVLARHLLQRDKQESTRFHAYSSAVSKMFSNRSVFAKRKRTQKSGDTLRQKIATAVTSFPMLEGKGGQLEWIF